MRSGREGAGVIQVPSSLSSNSRAGVSLGQIQQEVRGHGSPLTRFTKVSLLGNMVGWRRVKDIYAGQREDIQHSMCKRKSSYLDVTIPSYLSPHNWCGLESFPEMGQNCLVVFSM